MKSKEKKKIREKIGDALRQIPIDEKSKAEKEKRIFAQKLIETQKKTAKKTQNFIKKLLKDFESAPPKDVINK